MSDHLTLLCPCCQKPFPDNLAFRMEVDLIGLYFICEHCTCSIECVALPRPDPDGPLEFVLADQQPCVARH
jgi:hypothetical protein